MKWLLLLLLATGCTTTTQTDGPVQLVVPSPGPPTLVLRPGGLLLQAPDGPQDLPFGAGTGVVVPALAAVVGRAVAQEPSDCPQGPRTRLEGDGLAALFDGDRFVGWTASRSGPATTEGLHVGAPRPTTSPAGIAVEGTSTVTRLSAGETCDR